MKSHRIAAFLSAAITALTLQSPSRASTVTIGPSSSIQQAIDQVNAAGGGTVNLSYHLRPRTTVAAFVNAQRLTYVSLERTDKTYRYGIDVGHQWTPHWSWHVSYIRQLRNSNAVAQSYHENEVFFSVVFRR